MALDLAEFDHKAHNAVRLFWESRQAAAEKQLRKGRIESGERAGVTAGKNMDGFVHLMVDLVRQNGLGEMEIHLKRRLLTLPGYFRPTKLWDMLIIPGGHLIAALEFKSHIGPSFGNNFNNRAEEALGTATDLWTAYREGAFGQDAPRPFVGWLMLLEDSEESNTPVRDHSPHFPVLPDLQGVSYAMRYNILCRRMMQEQMYSAACVITSRRTAKDQGAYGQLSDLTGLRNFVITFAGHIAVESARLDCW